MKVDGVPYRTIWLADDGWAVEIIDQTRLPFDFVTVRLENVDDAAVAIRDMLVRGAPLIGATAAYGMALAMQADASDENLGNAYEKLLATRPTAVNLRWALDEMSTMLEPLSANERTAAAYKRAAEICDEDVDICSSIGDHGLKIIKDLHKKKGAAETVNILTHCNAGWLATVDWGTALAPIYKAFDAGIPVHVWVDETRPRNQGASLTAWELGRHGVPLTVIADNAGSGSGGSADHINCNATNGNPYTQAKDVCEAMKTAGVIVYTIGFDISSSTNVTDLLNNCASGPDQVYYAATGDELKDIYRQIGSEITKLHIGK